MLKPALNIIDAIRDAISNSIPSTANLSAIGDTDPNDQTSSSTVVRLKQTWGEEYKAWMNRRLDKDRWVYIWADGVYSGLRAEEAKLCALVIIGVNERGEKHFLAIEDGVRESTQSWREVLLGLKSRGLGSPSPVSDSSVKELRLSQ
jgi:transposase-like protein